MNIENKANEMKQELESAINKLESIETKRIRMEARYEAEMENLKKLGYNSVQEAIKDYNATMKKLGTEFEQLTKDCAEFIAEFKKLTEEN